MDASLTLSPNRDALDLRVEGADHLYAKMIPGRVFVRQGGFWRYGLSQENLDAIRARFPVLHVDPAVGERLEAKVSQARSVDALKRTDEDLDHSDMPIKATPYRHQVQAFRVAMTLLAS